LVRIAVRALSLAAAIVTVIVLAPTDGLAKGGRVTGAMPKLAVVLPVPPHVLRVPSAQEVLGGCGGRRHLDPATHRCRGPADF